jgi:hypothetical protein
MFGKKSYCEHCQFSPCIGGKGPGSCVGDSKKAGERRSTKVGHPENTVEHVHDYRVQKTWDTIITEGRKTWHYYFKESQCISKRGKCDTPVHSDSYRIRI